jgi:hypothetical protein
MGEQNELNKAAAPNISENSQTPNFFFLYFQAILPVTVQETNCYHRVYNPHLLYGFECQDAGQL